MADPLRIPEVDDKRVIEIAVMLTELEELEP
jgi:hypothetical protein